MKYFHYTLGQYLPSILSEKKIKKSPKYIKGNRSAAWFSTNPIWEESVRKVPGLKLISGVTCSRSKLLENKLTPARIEINPEKVKLLSWERFKKVSGISKWVAEGFEKLAPEWGANPKEWLASLKDVPLRDCLLSVEVWNGNIWFELKFFHFNLGENILTVRIEDFLDGSVVNKNGDMEIEGGYFLNRDEFNHLMERSNKLNPLVAKP